MIRWRNAAFAVPLLIAALVIAPRAALANEHTRILVVNDTGHWIYVQARPEAAWGKYNSWGMVKPKGLVTVDETAPFAKFRTSLFVTVLRSNSLDSKNVLCAEARMFPNNTTGGPPIRVDVHYTGTMDTGAKGCSIDPP